MPPDEGVADRPRIGSLMRCCIETVWDLCIETVWDLYPDGPARTAAEGPVVQCKHAPDDPGHRVRFRGGYWERDHDSSDAAP